MHTAGAFAIAVANREDGNEGCVRARSSYVKAARGSQGEISRAAVGFCLVASV
eukprot:SAG31_NODE_1232_length_9211_cov_31.167581_9_plen_53_part_00